MVLSFFLPFSVPYILLKICAMMGPKQSLKVYEVVTR